jgi:hypothetical protein
MSLPKLNKLYFPGLISLVFLPLMCVCYFVNNNVLINKWISVDGKKNRIETFRKYKISTLTGDLVHDEKELNNFKGQVAILAQREIDTANGIKLLLGKYAQYGEFVNILDVLLQKENQNISFDIIGNKIFIVHVAPTPKSSAPYLRGDLDNDVVRYQTKTPLISIEKIKTNLVKAYKVAVEFWPSLVAFLGLLGFAIYKRKRYFNLRKFNLFGG